MPTVAGVDSLVKVASTEEQAQRFLVEWYGPRATAHSISETVDGLNRCADSMSSRRKQVRLLTAMAVTADNYAFGVFAAGSEVLVAQVCGDAGAPAERISPAVGWVRAEDR